MKKEEQKQPQKEQRKQQYRRPSMMLISSSSPALLFSLLFFVGTIIITTSCCRNPLAFAATTRKARNNAAASVVAGGGAWREEQRPLQQQKRFHHQRPLYVSTSWGGSGGIVDRRQEEEGEDECIIPSEKLPPITSPASMFGNPINEWTRDVDKIIVHTLKNVLFDTFFREEDDDPIKDLTRNFNRKIVHPVKDILFNSFAFQEDDLMKDWTTKLKGILPDTVFQEEEDFKDKIKKDTTTTTSASTTIMSTTKTMDRSVARFYTLETIARMPYFSYLSVLHFYETMGWWRKAEALKIHYSETDNEYHHLLIMEQLGGNTRYFDRFLAQHIAFFYYWLVVFMFAYNPTHAYHLNQMVEEEAFQTYDKFLKEYYQDLHNLPAPSVAKQYYTGTDFYMYDAMQYAHRHHDTDDDNTSAMTDLYDVMIYGQGYRDSDASTTKAAANSNDSSSTTVKRQQRRPKMETLYDTFVAIRDDEGEHAKTMKYLQEGDGNEHICG